MVSRVSEGALLVIVDAPFKRVQADGGALSWANSYDFGPDDSGIFCGLLEFAFLKNESERNLTSPAF